MAALSSPGAPWSVEVDYSQPMACALLLRDCLNIEAESDIPPVNPVPHLPVRHPIDDQVQDPATVPAHWQEWWNQLLHAFANKESNTDPTPPGTLGRILTENAEHIHQWSSARKREVAHACSSSRSRLRLRHVIRDYEHTHATVVPPFHIRVAAVPVAGPVFIPRTENLIMVGITLLENRGQYLNHLLHHVVDHR
ncbi:MULTISPECIES: hypothetical protein [Streptacidiphilus]|uniref:Uncharacterized protein n=1 Tax=Streptacidiphilus cavernicola TaxID=3342716 RepID=A0ABV6UW23_9ACTN|nr:hypothetical protein [Streptacidiphilus jeojiense]